MPPIKPKKSLGQHFLHDKKTAFKIASLLKPNSSEIVLEIGPGTGALTQFFIPTKNLNTLLDFPNLLIPEENSYWMVEYDIEAFNYLIKNFNLSRSIIFNEDILKFVLPKEFQYSIISNLPYNISSPFLFYLLENRSLIRRGVFMVQKEVAQRICSNFGNKTYGILSVLLGWYYDLKYEFSVSKGVFTPTPNVESAVFTLERKPQDMSEIVDYKKFKTLVKASFSQRRKTLHNALKSINFEPPLEYQTKRAEELPIKAFIEMTQLLN